MDKKLRYIGRLYQCGDELLGDGGLDDALADFDLDTLVDVLESHYLAIRYHPPITPASEESWQAAINFVIEICGNLTRGAKNKGELDALKSKLMSLELLHSHLHVGKQARPERIRSLPPEVLEELFVLLNPDSATNPFRRGISRWTVYTIFTLLLNQGLRRGELLILPVDAVQRGFNRTSHDEKYLMYVRYNEYEDDPRFSEPQIKNASSVREVLVTLKTALVVEQYKTEYRGKADHSFLLNSQKRNPLSTERITTIFDKITNSLSKSARKLLLIHTGEESISSHMLRHTCAVVRLNQLLSEGVQMEEAVRLMRAYFGWSQDSLMPLRYAKAVFNERLASVWQEKFDDRVEILRHLQGNKK
jgi:integrase